jgi:hypothetical protein
MENSHNFTLNVAIIKHKIKDIVIMNFTGFIRAIIAWFI